MFKNYCMNKANTGFYLNWIEHFKLIGDIEMNWTWNAIWIEHI